jgi:hypothetical protein
MFLCIYDPYAVQNMQLTLKKTNCNQRTSILFSHSNNPLLIFASYYFHKIFLHATA